MNYCESLIYNSRKYKSIVCMGLDPVLEDIPIRKDSIRNTIVSFYESILNKCLQYHIYPACVKPNYAFYAQYGIEGLHALCDVITLFGNEGLPVILDVKRGDIGKTATAYAKEAFEFFNANAVTLSPFLGFDSIQPFTSNYPDKGYYILVKTSNKSSSEIQDIVVNNEPLYLLIAKKLIEWYAPGIGAVVGATFPQQLNDIITVFEESGKDIPLLIPGIGTQGGDMEAVIKILNNSKNKGLHRVNASSSINYAYKESQYHNKNFDEAAVEALKILNETLGY
ncbi:MAG: orotidine-5'-phosphate decarboxylase [Spirochaetota bacterium]|nr:orotidine-5'-phosphate decarboxylase [Spirochaetota bacterium]